MVESTYAIRRLRLQLGSLVVACLLPTLVAAVLPLAVPPAGCNVGNVWAAAVASLLLGLIGGYLILTAHIADARAAGEARNAATRVSEAHYRALFEAAGDGALVVGLGPTGPIRILEANGRVAELLGIATQEILARHPMEFVPIELNPDIPRLVAELAAIGQARNEATVRTPSGALIPVEAHARRVPAEGEEVVLVLLRDLRVQKAMEGDLRACGVRYGALFDAVADPIFVTELLETGLAGRTLNSNEAGSALLGATRDEIASRPLSEFLDVTSNPHLPELREEMLRAGRVSFAVTARKASGELVPVEGNARLVEINGARMMVLVVRDVSEQRRIEVERVTTLAELTDAHARLETLSRRLVAAQEDERRAVARELHDEVGQVLTALAIQLDLAAAADGDAAGLCKPPIRAARALVSSLLAQVRKISLDLRPALLDDLGLEPALRYLFERYTGHTAVQVEFVHAGLVRRFPAPVETAAFRIVQEALTNVAKHSGAPAATVTIHVGLGGLDIEIADRGRGFDPPTVPAGTSVGMHSMRERATLVGGTFDVGSGPQGTTVFVRLPVGRVG